MLEPFYQDHLSIIYNGNAFEVLKALPDESVQMCMTSPPYWGLRNYAEGANIIWGDNHCEHEWGDGLIISSRHETGETNPGKESWYKDKGGISKEAGNFCTRCGCWRGQLGLEPTPELYVEHLMMIFREVKRVLKKDGSFYLNIADTYAGSGGAHAENHANPGISQSFKRQGVPHYGKLGIPDRYLPPKGLQAKCMVCIPERILFAMLADNWILRNKNIWYKPNHMPGSQKDRWTQTWEYVYFFTKSRKYYFNLDAIRVPHKTESLERYQRGVNLGRPAEGKSGEVGPMQQYIRAPKWFKEMFPLDADYKGKFDSMVEKGSNTGENNKEPYQQNNPHRLRLYAAKEADLFGHGHNPQSFNLRVRDVKRGKKGVSAQSGELKASEQEIQNYEYPEKMQRHHGSGPQYKLSGLNRGSRAESRPLIAPHHRYRGDGWERQAIEGRDKKLSKHDQAVGRDGNVSYTDPLHTKGYYGVQTRKILDKEYKTRDPGRHENLVGKNPGDLWNIATRPSSISVCPKCDAVFPRLIKVCPYCKVEGIVSHFAPYPEDLCVGPIKASSRVGDIVLDPFMGGGTTGVVAKRLGRRSILIDCVRSYCVMARYKLQKVEYQPEIAETAQKAPHFNAGDTDGKAH